MISGLRRRGALLALLFAFALVAAACGDDDDVVAASTTAAPTTTTTTAAPATTTTAAPVTTTVAPTTTVPGTTLPPPASFKVCQVSDTGGIDDKSFNESAWNGAQRAEAELPNTTAKFLESQSAADFRPNIDSFIGEGCDRGE